MTTTELVQHRFLVKRYHTLCTRLGFGKEEKELILDSFGVTSSLELSVAELQNVCNKLDRQIRPQIKEADKWRKRVMAAIGGWLKMLNKETNAHGIKAIACRATGHKHFNDIPLERLRNLYYAFSKKQKDFEKVKRFTSEEIERFSKLN